MCVRACVTLNSSHPGHQQVHLQLGQPPTQAGPDAEAERDGAERVAPGPGVVSAEPAGRPEGVRLGEDALVVGHGVVTQVEQGLSTRRTLQGGTVDVSNSSRS